MFFHCVRKNGFFEKLVTTFLFLLVWRLDSEWQKFEESYFRCSLWGYFTRIQLPLDSFIWVFQLKIDHAQCGSNHLRSMRVRFIIDEYLTIIINSFSLEHRVSNGSSHGIVQITLGCWRSVRDRYLIYWRRSKSALFRRLVFCCTTITCHHTKPG